MLRLLKLKIWQTSVVNAVMMSGALLASSSDFVLAQNITLDGTVGPAGTLTGPHYSIPQNVGQTVGHHLFHSFGQFNLDTGEVANFQSAAEIHNILTRVTGGNPSTIDGLISTESAHVNLFLLNPSGIVFGPNARLNVAGSFLASTANSFKFPNGSEFSAITPQAPPLLSINLTPGLQYGANPAAITNAGNLRAGQDLTLAGGNLNLTGQLHAGRDLTLQAIDTLQGRDSLTTPLVASATGQLLVQGNQKVDIVALTHPSSGLFSGRDLVLRSANPVQGDAYYWTGGNFRIEQLNGNLGDLWSPADPIIRAIGDVNINSYTGASLHILAGGSVDLGSATITGTATGTPGIDFLAETITLSNGSTVTIDGSARPTLDVRAGMNPAEVGNPLGLAGNFASLNPANPLSSTRTSADITIDKVAFGALGGLVLLTNQYKPDLTLTGGTITIREIDTTRPNSFIGNAGSVILDARNEIRVTGSANRITASSETGNAGDITLLAKERILLDGSAIRSNTNARSGAAGDITIQARSLHGMNGALIAAITQRDSSGNAGKITIQAQDEVFFENNRSGGEPGGVSSQVFRDTPARRNRGGNGNDINITVTNGKLSLIGNVSINTSTQGIGNAGDITIEADEVLFNGQGGNVRAIDSRSREARSGNAGNVSITTQQLSVINGARVSAASSGSGNAGNISVMVPVNPVGNTSVSIDGNDSGLSTSTAGAGKGGNITIQTGDFSLSNRALLNAETTGRGAAGAIEVKANTVSITDRAKITTVTSGAGVRGDAGDISIEASDSVLFQSQSQEADRDTGLLSSSEPGGRGVGNNGKPGNISIKTGTFSVIGNATASAATTGSGKAGDITIEAREQVLLDGQGSVGNTRAIESRARIGEGDGGNINITTKVLTMRNRARVSTRSSSTGDAGNIIVNALDSITISGIVDNTPRSITPTSAGGLDTEAGSSSPRSGNIEVNTGTLRILDNAVLSTRTRGSSPGGNITVRANTVELLNGGRIIASSDGSAGALASGTAGNITVEATDRVALIGSGIANRTTGIQTSTNQNSTGNAGRIKVETPSLAIVNFAGITATTQGGGQGGDIQVQADALTLDKQGRISAETFSNQGGNITLQVQDLLLLRRESQISTTSGIAQQSGNGGNITINAPLIVAAPLENSDITANAFSGSGGKVTINDNQGIFWMVLRSREDLVRLLGTTDPLELNPNKLPTNDITAISQGNPALNGTVIIDPPDVDPNQGLVELPTNLVDRSGLISQACSSTGKLASSSFVITGQGGLPPNPTATLPGETVIPPRLATVNDEQTHRSLSPQTIGTADSSIPVITEAQEWVKDAKGEVLLVAATPNQTVQPLRSFPACQ